MRITDLFEAHHEYDNPDYNTPFHSVKKGDTFRVFHGFRDKEDAIRACRIGLSGKERANRVYSYEFDNNPVGVFISLSLKVAADFGNSIIEFDCSLDELEAPVWPGGSYTVQGGYSQYFGRGNKGRAARNQRQKAAELETEKDVQNRPDLENVKQSDKKYLAYMLTNSREYQALYIGHLDPARIKAVYVKENPNHVDSKLIKISVADFLKDAPTEKYSNKLFKPYEEFSEELFLQRLDQKHNNSDIMETLANIWSDVKNSPHSMESFQNYLGQLFYPKQLPVAFNWFKRKFR